LPPSAHRELPKELTTDEDALGDGLIARRGIATSG
jgi:hypothetical protein